MFDILLNLGSFLVGMNVGSIRSSNVTESERLISLQNSLNDSYENEQMFKNKWMEAEQKAESWERRYNNLLFTSQNSFEE